MLAAADKGVRVRILLDDIPIDEATETILYALDQHKNIEVRLFNPFANRGFRFADYIFSPKRINRRMHNKSFTVDGEFTVVGGRNIGDEYFSAHEESNFEDIDIMATGLVVKEIESQFDRYWNSQLVYPVSVFSHNKATQESLRLVKQELTAFAELKKDSMYHLDIQDSQMYKSLKQGTLSKEQHSLLFNGNVKVVYDAPEKGLGKSDREVSFLKDQVKASIKSGNKNISLEIISPYFVPGDAGVKLLADLVSKGIKVRILTNSLSSTDGVMAQSGYSRRRYDLLESGVEMYEMKTEFKTKASKSLKRANKAKSALHGKIYIFDRKQIFIGSFNLDQRSAQINSEVGVIYDVPEMAEFIATELFDKWINDSTYQVKIADKDIDKNGVKIDKGDIYWFELKNNENIYYDTEPETGFWRRFSQGFFSILPIESQL